MSEDGETKEKTRQVKHQVCLCLIPYIFYGAIIKVITASVSHSAGQTITRKRKADAEESSRHGNTTAIDYVDDDDSSIDPQLIIPTENIALLVGNIDDDDEEEITDEDMEAMVLGSLDGPLQTPSMLLVPGFAYKPSFSNQRDFEQEDRVYKGEDDPGYIPWERKG